MEMRPIAISTFARYYEATGAGKIRIVKEARSQGRDFYWALRNVWAETHWLSDDISTFEDALGPLIASQTSTVKQEHFSKLGRAYINFWKEREGARIFKVPTIQTEIAGLTIRVATEIGMSYEGDNLALRLYLRAQAPTRAFRRAIQHITERAKDHNWSPNWQAATLNVRRQEILQPIPLTKDFDIDVESQATAFLQTWQILDQQAAAAEKGQPY